MRGFDVIPSELARASRVWDEQASRLEAVRKRLEAADAAAVWLGDRAGPETGRFLRGWARRVSTESATAQRWSGALSDIGQTYVRLDEQAANDLRQALPWGSETSIEPATHGLPFNPGPRTLSDLYDRPPAAEPAPPGGTGTGPIS